MISKRLVLACLAVLLLVVSVTAGDKRMTIEDSLAIKNVGDIRWTPDSKSLLLTIRKWQKKDNSYITHIYLVPRDGGDTVQLTRGEKGELSPRISPDGEHLAFLASRDQKKEGEDSGGGGSQVWMLPMAGGESFKLTDEEHGVSAFTWSPDSSKIAFVTRDVFPDLKERKKQIKDKFDAVVVDRDFSWSHLWVIAIAGKEKKRLTEGDYNVASPEWSPTSDTIAFQAAYVPHQSSAWKHIDDNRQSDVLLVSAGGGETRNLTPGPGRANGPQWSQDGRQLVFGASTSEDDSRKFDLIVTNVAGNEIHNLSANDPDSIGGALFSANGKELFYSQGQGLYTHIFQIPSAGGDSRQLSSEFGLQGGIFALSPDGEYLAYTANDPNRPGDVWVSRSDGSNASKITDVNPQIEEFAIADSRPIRWKATDGQEIEGVLILPLEYQEGQQYPLILQIHGGPTGRFTHTFNSRQTQIWAARGFAILQPNPRGSTGYGHAFTQANQGDWGGKDFHYDDMAGVDHVIELGIADPEKMVVMGGSYGGFSTFWAVTQTDRFKAAIGHAAISDWYSFYGQTDIPQYLKWGFEGHAWENPDTYRRFSPVEFVENVKTPLLITHGERDFRVHIAQAEQYYTALKKLGVEVEFVRYPREGHGIREPNHVIDLAGRQEEWFDRHLGIEREKPAEAETQ